MLVNTTRRFRSSAVLIMSKENHSIVRTLLSKRYQTGVTSAKEVVCSCLFVAGGVAHIEIPTTQRFHRHSFNLKITHRCSYRLYEVTVKVVSMGMFYYLPRTRK